jgi:hypothetical protein
VSEVASVKLQIEERWETQTGFFSADRKVLPSFPLPYARKTGKRTRPFSGEFGLRLDSTGSHHFKYARFHTVKRLELKAFSGGPGRTRICDLYRVKVALHYYLRLSVLKTKAIFASKERRISAGFAPRSGFRAGFAPGISHSIHRSRGRLHPSLLNPLYKFFVPLLLQDRILARHGRLAVS